MRALHSSERLLMDSIREKDSEISTLRDIKERHITFLNERNSEIQTLKHQLQQITDNRRTDLEGNSLTSLENNVNVIHSQLKKMETKLMKDENGAEATKRSLQQTIEALQSQLKGSEEMRKAMEGQLHSENRSEINSNTRNEGGTRNRTSLVTIYHDSLVNDVNNTLMGRTDVTVKKVWAPTLAEIQSKVHETIDTVDTIVIQALTRDLGNMDTEEFLAKLYDTVEMCLSKAENVLISHVVRRCDSSRTPGIEKKVQFVNASIKVKYMHNVKITLCDHDNLDEHKYRRADQLHLTEIGTSRYANNLKFGIADSLNITIERKKKTPNHHDNYNRQDNNRADYRGTAWERRNQRWKFEKTPFRSRWDEE